MILLWKAERRWAAERHYTLTVQNSRSIMHLCRHRLSIILSNLRHRQTRVLLRLLSRHSLQHLQVRSSPRSPLNRVLLNRHRLRLLLLLRSQLRQAVPSILHLSPRNPLHLHRDPNPLFPGSRQSVLSLRPIFRNLKTRSISSEFPRDL